MKFSVAALAAISPLFAGVTASAALRGPNAVQSSNARGLMERHLTFAPLPCNANLTVSDCSGPDALGLSSLVEAANGTEAVVPCGVCAVADVSDGSVLSLPSGLNVEGMLYFPPEADVAVEARRVFVQGILKIDPPAAGNRVRFRLTGPDEDERLFPHPSNAMACNATTGCNVGKRPVAVAGGRLDIRGMANSDTCPGYVPLRSASSSGEVVFNRTEAEAHDAQSGVGTSTIVHNFDSGNWMTYKDVDFGPTGVANYIRIRYSKGCCNGKVELRLGGPDGQLIGSLTPKRTAGWGTYVEKTFSIDAADVSGPQDLTLIGQGDNGIMNLDWFELEHPGTAETRLSVGQAAAVCWEGLLGRGPAGGGGGIKVLVTSAEGRGTWTGHHVLQASHIDASSGEIVIPGLLVSALWSDPDFPPTLEREPHFAAEVAVLTRPVVFESVSDGPSKGGFSDLHGGHLIVYHTPGVAQRLEGAEMRGFGQQGVLGRYPIHFHMSGDVDGSVVRNNAVVDSNQRCVVVHGTHKVRVENNVAYNSFGHCYITEDGTEEDNHFVGNLGALTRNQLLGIGATDHEASLFWITNTKNHFINNVATGSQDSGIWFETNGAARYFPMYTFDGNVVHNNLREGLKTYRPGWRNPSTAVFNNFKAYKNGGPGIDLHGTCRIKIKGGIIAANSAVVMGNRPGSNHLEDTQMYAVDSAHADGGRCVHGYGSPTGVVFSLEPNYEMIVLTNVTFKGFGPAPDGCTNPGRPITLNQGNDIRDKYDSPTWWSDIKFEPASAQPFAFAISATSYVNNIIYLEDKDGTMTPSAERGFFVADFPYMTAFVQDSCSPSPGYKTAFCANVCLRRLQVKTGCCTKYDSDPNPLPVDYRMVVTSASDPSKTFTYDKSYWKSWPRSKTHNDRFDLVLPEDYDIYDVSFVDADGNAGFPAVSVKMFDAPACGDHVTLESLRFATPAPSSTPSYNPTVSSAPSNPPTSAPSSDPTASHAPSSSIRLFALIEAEDHDAQSGVGTSTTVHNFDSGNYMTYDKINFGPAGTTNSIRVRYSKGCCSGKVELRLGGADGQLIGSLTPKRTADWGTYKETSLSINGAEGIKQLTLVGKDSNGIMNLDWFQLSPFLFTRIQAEDHVASQGVGTSFKVWSFDSGDYVSYDNIDFGPAGTTNSIRVRYAKGCCRGKLDMRLGGPHGQHMGSFYPKKTGSWSKYVEGTFSIMGGIGGVQNVTFVGRDSSGIMNFDWFELSP